jgi:hypothetical protein
VSVLGSFNGRLARPGLSCKVHVPQNTPRVSAEIARYVNLDAKERVPKKNPVPTKIMESGFSDLPVVTADDSQFGDSLSLLVHVQNAEPPFRKRSSDRYWFTNLKGEPIMRIALLWRCSRSQQTLDATQAGIAGMGVSSFSSFPERNGRGLLNQDLLPPRSYESLDHDAQLLWSFFRRIDRSEGSKEANSLSYLPNNNKCTELWKVTSRAGD